MIMNNQKPNNTIVPASDPENILIRIAKNLEAKYDIFCLATVIENDAEIVYANENFYQTTQFAREEIVGQSATCAFLYGNDTRIEHIQRIKTAVANRSPFKTSLVMYRASGMAFIGSFEIQPIRTEHGDVAVLIVSLTVIANLEADKNKIFLPSSTKKKASRKFSKMPRFTKKKKPSTGKSPQLETKYLTGAQEYDSIFMKQVEKESFLLDPNGTFKFVWDWMILVTTFYIGVVTPYNSVFKETFVRGQESVIGNWIVEFFFIIDMILTFRTPIYDKMGRMIKDPKEIAKSYLLSWFWIDLLAAIPYDEMFAILGTRVPQWLVLLKCVRLLRLLRLFNKLEQYSQYNSVILVIYMAFYVLLAHWFACIWYLIGRDDYNNGTTLWNQGWLYRLDRYRPGTYTTNKPETINVNPQQRYWTAFYFSLTMLTSVGFGNEAANTVPEKIACCVAMPIFALMHALVFGYVTAIIQRMYARRFAYDLMAYELRDFYRIYSIPRTLKRKIQEFYQNVWTMNRGINHEKILQDFPDELQADVCMHIYHDFFNLPIFSAATKGCLKALALQVKQNFVYAGEFMVHKGDAPEYFYFISSGTLGIYRDGKLIAVAEKGDFIGVDLSHPYYSATGKSGVDVVAASYSSLQCLSITTVLDCLTLYPEFGLSFCGLLSQELAFNLVAYSGTSGTNSQQDSVPPTPISLVPHNHDKRAHDSFPMVDSIRARAAQIDTAPFLLGAAQASQPYFLSPPMDPKSSSDTQRERGEEEFVLTMRQMQVSMRLLSSELSNYAQKIEEFLHRNEAPRNESTRF